MPRSATFSLLPGSPRDSRLWRDVPFSELKDAVLGKDYELSLAFPTSARSRALNKQYRGKDKPANVLSFPLEKHAGEILICIPEARKQAPTFNLTPRACIAMLFIHGLFHLKGLNHGSTMERRERAIRKRFSL